MSADKLTLYRKSGKTGEITIDLDDLFSQDGGFSLCDDSTVWATVYMGPNSSGVLSGYVFVIENITVTNRGDTSLVRFKTATDGSDFYNLVLGATETFYIDAIKGLKLTSGQFAFALASGGGITTFFHIGGRLRPADTWGA